MKYFNKPFFTVFFFLSLFAFNLFFLILAPQVSYASSDLKIMSIRLDPAVPIWNKAPVKVKVTVKNIGTLQAPKKSSLMMYIYSVRSKTAKKDIIPGTALTSIFPNYSYNIPRLKPGKEITITKNLPAFTFSGWHWLQANINTEGFSAGEENHLNNYFERWFAVKEIADLVICFKKHNVSKRYAKNTYPVKIKNVGTTKSPKCRLSFQIDSKGTKRYSIPPLNPGQTHSVQREVYWGWKHLGVHSFQIRIGCETGSNEKRDNNKFEGFIRVPRRIDMKSDPWKNSKTVCSDTFQ